MFVLNGGIKNEDYKNEGINIKHFHIILCWYVNKKVGTPAGLSIWPEFVFFIFLLKFSEISGSYPLQDARNSVKILH